MNGRLQGKVCVITGGATGMGGVASKLFAKEGAKVVIGDLKEADAKKTAEEITNPAEAHRTWQGT